MKIEREDDEFKPITITMESEEEACLMMDIMNVIGLTKTSEIYKYLNRLGLKPKIPSDMSMPLSEFSMKLCEKYEK